MADFLGLRKIEFRTLRFWQVLKAGAGAAVAIVAALGIGLLNAPSAGIVTLLTIQNTRRETFLLIAKRLLGFVCSTALAWIAFTTVGFDAWGFGVFVLLFVAFANLFGLQDAIAMNAVLATHYLVWEDINLMLVLNEAGLLLIGMALGVLFNLAMPRNLPYIRREQVEIDQQIVKILQELSKRLRGEPAETESNERQEQDGLYLESLFSRLNKQMDRTAERTAEAAGNTWQPYMRYLAAYLTMRGQQISLLAGLMRQFDSAAEVWPQNFSLAAFLEEIALDFHEDNDASSLLKSWDELRGAYRMQALPQSRTEFEHRATLLQMMEQIRYFLRLKQRFHIEWSPQNDLPLKRQIPGQKNGVKHE